MPRTQIKGGIWKNTEDEILKAAVMKYGKNQWARISSLLVRKSAKQCKTRWYEWLDPSIRKTEWSKEEEEKLLHLAKLMPTQWRTIAPIVGRTASQCLEHYNKLLDAAQDEDLEGDDPRRLRPGEIDPNPENKPARPDPVDMDEDEKEMLQEARARLANTMGKKAKRKAREKQLEEARRLATLQKRRELKAAGIDIPRGRKKLKGIDYNKEIPFEKRPPPGFFEVPLFEKKQPISALTGVHLEKLEGKSRDEVEEMERKKDAQRQKARKDKSLPDALNEMNKEGVHTQRVQLVLPEPQINDEDLQEMAKMGYEGEMLDADNSATQGLLPTYAQTPMLTPGRTPMSQMTPGRTPMSTSQTPVLMRAVGQTPLSVRDDLGLNDEDRYHLQANKEQIASGLLNLPAPQNEYKISLPELPEEEQEREEFREDAAALFLENQQQLKEEQAKKDRLRSQVLKRSLPRPLSISSSYSATTYNGDEELKAAESLVNDEVISFLINDAVEYPIDNAHAQIPRQEQPFEKFTEQQLEQAKQELADQHEEDQITTDMDIDSRLNAWNETYKDVHFIPSKRGVGRFSRAANNDLISYHQNYFETLQKQISEQQGSIGKLEKKLSVYNGGYQVRTRKLNQEISTLYSDVYKGLIDLESFKRLYETEQDAIPQRIQSLKDDVEAVTKKETMLQQKYSDLMINV